MKSGKLSEDLVTRGNKHEAAFLCPVPFKTWTPAANCLSVSKTHTRAQKAVRVAQQLGQTGQRSTQRARAHGRMTGGQRSGSVFGAPFSGATVRFLLICRHMHPSESGHYFQRLSAWVFQAMGVLLLVGLTALAAAAATLAQWAVVEVVVTLV